MKLTSNERWLLQKGPRIYGPGRLSEEVLDHLERRGLVKLATVEPGLKCYRITPAGRAALEAGESDG